MGTSSVYSISVKCVSWQDIASYWSFLEILGCGQAERVNAVWLGDLGLRCGEGFLFAWGFSWVQ